MSAPGLIIFDCDGVLVDSEPISIQVLLDMIAEAGGAMDEETAYQSFLGRSMATVVEILRERYGLSVDDDDLARSRTLLYQRFERDLRPIPGLSDALESIRVSRCVASSSQPDRIRLSLALTGLLAKFEPHIYSASMVERGKPAPDLFLHAARDMGVAPADCIVIEDSPAGIEAAKLAGMRVFAFTGGTHAAGAVFRDALARLGPDLVFDDMRRLPSLVAATSGEAPR